MKLNSAPFDIGKNMKAVMEDFTKDFSEQKVYLAQSPEGHITLEGTNHVHLMTTFFIFHYTNRQRKSMKEV